MPENKSPSVPGGILAFRSGPCLTKAGVGAALGGGEVTQDLMPAPYAVQQQLADLHQVFSPPVPAVWLRALSEAAECCEQADLCCLPGGNERLHLACRSEPYVNSLVKMYVRRPYCCHELFGFDIMLDENLKPWILEVNISPR